MIEIFTLGSWDIKYKNQTIFDTIGYQEKLMKLFIYFLIHEGQRLHGDKIIDDLYAYEDYYDPRSTLRTQISRVRNMFQVDDFFSIKNVGGYYVFKLEEECRIDFLDFENNLNQGNYLLGSNSNKAKELLKKGLYLYKGELLEQIQEDWIIPQRTRYNRVYLNSINNYLSLLEKDKQYTTILEVTEEAIGYHPYEEGLNTYYIEALVYNNQRQYALGHYEYFTSKLYTDFGLGPSDDLKNIYQEIKNNNGEIKVKNENLAQEKTRMPLENYNGKKEEIDSWNLEFFNALEDIGPPSEDRMHEKADYLILVNIVDKSVLHENNIIKENIDKLVDIINKGLREGDGLYRCMDGPLLLKLKQISYYNIQTVQRRLEEELAKEGANPNLGIEVNIKIIE